ncbi:MAG: arginine repressor [Firmicutes bacterium]|nr:arginine repressor [Bacillota bacterium]
MPARTDKRSRQSVIQQIIEQIPVDTQEALTTLLEDRGIHATQATISRDIKEMGLIKVPYEDGYRYAVTPAPASQISQTRLMQILREMVREYVVSENLIVVQTLHGGADVVAEAIDVLQWPEVAGTLAGETTVLVVARSKEMAPAVVKRLDRLR